MNQLDAVEAMGLLLRDRQWRDRFASDRAGTIKELGIAPSQSKFFAALKLEQLDAQAESLIRKRRTEVARLIPETWSRLGSEGRCRFHQYADQSAWPEGHRRHFIDAAQFCEFLRSSAEPEYLRSEHHWVEFVASDRTFSVRLVSDLVVCGKERWAIQLCIRHRGLAARKSFRLMRSNKRFRHNKSGASA